MTILYKISSFFWKYPPAIQDEITLRKTHFLNEIQISRRWSCIATCKMANKLKAPKAPIVTMAQTPATISQSVIKIEMG